MCEATLNTIMKRIAVAKKASPIAVFDDGAGLTMNCVFFSTVETQRRLKLTVAGLVGIFHGGMKQSAVRARLARDFDEKFRRRD